MTTTTVPADMAASAETEEARNAGISMAGNGHASEYSGGVENGSAGDAQPIEGAEGNGTEDQADGANEKGHRRDTSHKSRDGTVDDDRGHQAHVSFDRVELDEQLSPLENVEFLSKHYRISNILIKSLFNLNNKKIRKFPNTASDPIDDKVCRFILNLESEIIDFIIAPSVDSWKMHPLNSYYRLLSHQLAEYYDLGHILSNDGSSMVLFKINTSLVNADDETKKSAQFDPSGNIKPLDFNTLTFDPNEKLNRIKLADIYHSYREFFSRNYNEPEYDQENNEHLVEDLQNLQLESKSHDSNIKNVRIMKRREDKSSLSPASSKPQDLQNPTQKESESDISKEERYRLAKEKIEHEITGDDLGDDEEAEAEATSPKEERKELLADRINDITSQDVPASGSYAPVDTNGTNGYKPFRKNQDFNGYKRHMKNYKRNKNPNYNSQYRYQYSYYPPNQMYTSTPMIPTAPYNYIMPMNSPQLRSSNPPPLPYYYVPMVASTMGSDANDNNQEVKAGTRVSTAIDNATANGSTGEEATGNSNREKADDENIESEEPSTTDSTTAAREEPQDGASPLAQVVYPTVNTMQIPLPVGMSHVVPNGQFQMGGRSMYQYGYPAQSGQYYQMPPIAPSPSNMPQYMPYVYYNEQQNGMNQDDGNPVYVGSRSRKSYGKHHNNPPGNGNNGFYTYNNTGYNNNRRTFNNNYNRRGTKNGERKHENGSASGVEGAGEGVNISGNDKVLVEEK